MRAILAALLVGSLSSTFATGQETVRSADTKAGESPRRVLHSRDNYAWIDQKGEWCGTSGELLEAIELKVNEQTKRQKSWPKNARSMSGHLKRLSPNLRVAGWDVEYNREPTRRLWSIQRCQSFASQPSSLPPPEPHFDHPTGGNTMQSNANSYQHLFNDANDDHDANSGA